MPPLVFLLILLSAILSVCSAVNISRGNWEEENSFPRSEYSAKNFNGGYGGFLSAIFWVGSIFEYSKVLFDGESPNRMEFYFGSACDLDTNWAYSRLLTGWVFLDTKGIDPLTAIPFLEDGAKRFPGMWKFRITWAQALIDNIDDSLLANDSAAKVLLPLSVSNTSVPEYARNLAFTLMHKNGKPDQSMDILVQSYLQVPDPLVRHQFQRKIGDLLWRNKVFLGADSSAFVGGIGSMLDADPVQAGAAKALLIRLVQPETKDAALLEARHLARQFRSFQAAQIGAPQ